MTLRYDEYDRREIIDVDLCPKAWAAQQAEASAKKGTSRREEKSDSVTESLYEVPEDGKQQDADDWEDLQELERDQSEWIPESTVDFTEDEPSVIGSEEGLIHAQCKECRSVCVRGLSAQMDKYFCADCGRFLR